MRHANKELENQILKAAIDLLTENEPAEIGMRDVAKKCGVSATSIRDWIVEMPEIGFLFPAFQNLLRK